ncbi:MAG: hypothetical protein M1840_002676 [Geoglossum simile]|nr:MAG: hypothetical protein M1840_002676 [Geoglossum simile]
MAHLSKSEIIKSNPVREGLNAFCISFISASPDIPKLSDAVEHMSISDQGEMHRPDVKFSLTDIGIKKLVTNLIFTLQNLPAADLLPSPNGRGVLSDDLLRFFPLLASNDFNVRLVISLLNKVIDKAPDADILDTVYVLVTQSTPPPRPLPRSDRTPIMGNTSTSFNTSEYRRYLDDALKDELNSSLHIDIPGFFDAFFSGVTNLESVTEAVFRKCKEGDNGSCER